MWLIPTTAITGGHGGSRVPDSDTTDKVWKWKIQERTHPSENFWDLSCQDSEIDFTQSLEKHQTRKALLHKPMFLRLGKSLPIYLASTLGQLFSHDLEFSEEKGYLLFTALFTMEAVGHVLGIKASWGYWGFYRPGRQQALSGSDHFHGWYHKHTHIPCLCWCCLSAHYQPLLLGHLNHWNTSSNLEIWESVWKSLV